MRTPLPQSPRSGFTLIELTVALSIAVVLAGVVLVRVDGWSPRQKLNTSARALGNTIRTWREKAQLEESVYMLQIDSDKGARGHPDMPTGSSGQTTSSTPRSTKRNTGLRVKR